LAAKRWVTFPLQEKGRPKLLSLAKLFPNLDAMPIQPVNRPNNVLQLDEIGIE
jgi:hypothetical protein